MLHLALLVVLVGAAHVAAAGIEATRRTCLSLALNLSESLAAYHCRHFTPITPPFARPDLEDTVYTMIDWTNCAYDEYDFVHGEIPKPLTLYPTTAGNMMISCLLQNAAINFIRDLPYDDDIEVPSRCPKEVLDIHIYDPLNYSREILNTLDIDAMLRLPNRPACLDVVMSGFAREYINKVVLPEQPDVPRMTRKPPWIKLKHLTFELQKMPKGVEWPTLLSHLKAWKKGQLARLAFEYPNGPNGLPVCTVWYYENWFRS
jgi:hypothetical protein